ncbi:MAG: ParB/Srx family N-terminal domain-containing protein [Alphaproteobacteria bacterium]|nr:ParB/Srx family N-terminal domain-containing protein [Alphaproteobacteria bacterium]
MKNAQLSLDQLEIHPRNVRAGTAYDEDGLAALAANIEAFGLLQPLVVQALEAKGRYGVVAGGRRLAALKRLAEAGTGSLDKISCRVLPKDAAVTPASLSENAMQEVMSPIAEFEAFVAMVDEGRAIDNIALLS